MNALALIISFALLTALAFAPVPARAQEKPTNAPAARKSPPDPAPAPVPSTTEFRFDGGSFRDFTRKLSDQFTTNFTEVLDVRGEEAYHLRVPKMRQIFSAPPGADWSKVLKLYNQISDEGDGFLGKWIFTPSTPWTDGARYLPPQTLIFLPPRPAAGEAGAVQVRAFPIRNMPRDRLNQLRDVIEIESQRSSRSEPSLSLGHGRLNVHEGSELLVAVGSKAYVDLVQTVVEAFMTNYPTARLGK